MNTRVITLLSIVSSFYILDFGTDACSPPNGWQYISDGERAQKAEIIVYGTVVQSPRTGLKSERGPRYRQRHYKARFQLHCVFKGPKLPNFINVTGFGHVPGLCTNSKAYLNRTYVVFLKNKNRFRGRFRVDEINVQRGTIEIKSKVKLKEILRAVGENSFHPIGALKSLDSSCMKRKCTEVYNRRTRTRRHKKRKCCRRKNCPPRNTRAPESTFPSTTLEKDSKFTELRSFDETGEATLALLVGESKSSCSAGLFPKHWLYMLGFYSLMFVLIRWQQT